MCAFALPTVGALRCDSLPAAAAGRAMCRRVRAWQEDTAAALDQLEREGLVECRARAAKLGCAPHAGSPRPAPFRCGAPAMVAAAESAVRRCSRQTHGASPSPSIAARNRWSRWHGASIDELDRVLALTHEQFLEEQLEVLCTYPPLEYPVVPSAWYLAVDRRVPASTLAAHTREARSVGCRSCATQRNASVRRALFQVATLQSDDQRALRVRTQLKGLHFEALGADVHKVYSISRVPMLRTPREWAALKWWPFGTADVEKVRVRVDPSVSPHPLPAFSTGDGREIAPPSHLQRMLMWSADPIHASLTHLQPADEKVPEAARARAWLCDAFALCADLAWIRSLWDCSATSLGLWETTSSCTPSSLRAI